MPFYKYQALPGEKGCDLCRNGFEKHQRMKDDALTQCPQCGSRIQRLVYPIGISTPKTPSELKNLGFTKLVKRDEGVYENVTRMDGEARYMERDKPETMPNIKKRIAD